MTYTIEIKDDRYASWVDAETGETFSGEPTPEMLAQLEADERYQRIVTRSVFASLAKPRRKRRAEESAA